MRPRVDVARRVSPASATVSARALRSTGPTRVATRHGPRAAHMRSRRDTMQRRYPGRHGERGDPSDWQARDERAYRGAGERGMRDDPARWPEDDEAAYRRFASEDVGPEDWGSEWSERDARPVGQRRGRADAWQRGLPREPHEPEYGSREHRAQDREWREGRDRGDAPEFRGQHRTGGYAGDRTYGDPRYGGSDPSRFGSEAERDALRRRRGPKGYTRTDERIREDV
ncbi:hypothetical protein ACUBUD_35235, partial [Burkholderia metallica]